MHRLARATAVLSLTVLAAGAPTGPAGAQEAPPSLYHRMGGYDVVAAVVDDFFARFDRDPILQPFLESVDEASAPRVRQHFVDFLCARTGGPCAYHGRSMAAAHRGMGIGHEHFRAVMGHFRDALEAQGVAEQEREEVLSILRSLREEIVGG